jgi:hypothetical protein
LERAAVDFRLYFQSADWRRKGEELGCCSVGRGEQACYLLCCSWMEGGRRVRACGCGCGSGARSPAEKQGRKRSLSCCMTYHFGGFGVLRSALSRRGHAGESAFQVSVGLATAPPVAPRRWDEDAAQPWIRGLCSCPVLGRALD